MTMLNLLPETLNNPGGASGSCRIVCQPESAATPEASGSTKSRAFAEFLPEKSGKDKKNHNESTEKPSQHSQTSDTRTGVQASYGTVSEKRTTTNASRLSASDLSNKVKDTKPRNHEEDH